MTTPTASAPTSWAGRYGQVLLAAGVAPIPTVLFAYQAVLDLPAAAVWFIARVLAGAWDAGLPRVSLHTLAAQAGISLRQVQRYQATLQAQGHLRIQPRFDGRTGGQLPSGYDFGGLFARLEELLAAEGPPPNPIAEDDGPPPAPVPVADTSLVARYSRLIAGAGLAAIPQALFTQQARLALKPAHVWFVCYLLAHRWSQDFPYPSLKKMAARTGYSQEYLHTLKDELVAGGYLRVIPRHGPHGERSNNAYDLSGLFAALLNAEARRAPLVGRGARNAEGRGDPPVAAGIPARRGRRSLDGPQRAAAGSDRERALQKPQPEGTTRESDSVPRSAFRDPTSGGSERSSWMDSSWIDSSSSQLDVIPPSQADVTPPSQLDDTPLVHVIPPSQADGTPPSQLDDIPPSQVAGIPAAAPVAGARPDSAWLRRLTADLTREIEAPLGRPAEATRTEAAANATQALTLWRTSGLPEAAFAERMQEARRRTQAAKGHQRGGGLRRPMAYFFRVLAELVRSGPDTTADPAPAPRISAPHPPAAPPLPSPVLPSTPAGVPTPPPTSAFRGPRSEFGTAFSPYIAGVLLDYGRELGAGASGPGYVTQALRLWAASNLGETPFVGLLHTARRQVRGGTLPAGTPLNVMPQFFAVLQALLAEVTSTPVEGGC